MTFFVNYFNFLRKVYCGKFLPRINNIVFNCYFQNEKEKLVLEKRLQEIRKLEMASMERSERKVRDAKQTLVEMRVSAEVHRQVQVLVRSR